MKVRLEGIPAELVPTAWKRTEPFIKKLLTRTWGDIDAKTIFSDLISSQLQLWHIVNENDKLLAIWLTEIYTEPTGIKVCNWVGCAGTGARDWLHLRHEIEQWAKDRGATHAKISGRKGWESLLADYKPISIEMLKEL